MKKHTKALINELPIRRLVSLFFAFLIATIGFVGVAYQVRQGDTLMFDENALLAINGLQTPELDLFFVAATQLGGVIGVAAITIGIFIALLFRKKYRKATLLGAAVAGAALINVTLKLLFERPRPDLWNQLITETSFSFPSGHAMASSALAFALLALCWKTRYRWLALVLVVVYVVIIGVSRLYLGVHYPTDVIAGWLVSGAWVLCVVMILSGWKGLKNYRPLHKKHEHHPID